MKRILVVIAMFMVLVSIASAQEPVQMLIWDDTHVLLPFRSSSEKCRNAFTGEVLDLQKTDEYAKIGVSKALAGFPVALCLLD